MKKKRTFNILIVILAAVVIGCGVMAIGTSSGWFGDEDVENSTLVSETADVTGETGAEETELDVQNGTETETANEAEDENSDNIGTCTICIKCSAVLKHMDNLKSGREKYIPSNGIILSTSTIEFRSGENVYDILKRSASAAGIPVSARNSSYGIYVEGINGLFEFDCGGASGWKYSVNGKTPGHACSSHKVEKGDNIVWYYTCGN